jgi:hypothetical protein
MKDLKYYLYISDTKIEMLYAQIPSSLQKKFALDLNIDVKLLGAGVGAALKHTEQEETRYSKLKLVLKYLEEQQEIGWLDAPKDYVQGTLSMRWGLFPEKDKPYSWGPPELARPHIAFFGGSTGRTIVGLAGSPKHVLGYQGAETGLQPMASPSVFPYTYLEYLIEKEEGTKFSERDFDYEGKRKRLPQVIKQMRGMESQVEFVAKTLSHTPLREFHAYVQGLPEAFVLLGSPLYIALT